MTDVQLAPSTFEKYMERGVMHIATFVRVIGGNRTPGWGGYEYNTLLKNKKVKYRCKYRKGHYSTVRYSNFLNELYFRFVTPYFTHDDMHTGVLRKYMIATYRPDDTGKLIEEIIYWRPNGISERDWSNDVIMKYSLTSQTCQDYLFYVRRENKSPHKHCFRLFYHDVDLPRIPTTNFTTKSIVEGFTGTPVDFMELPTSRVSYLRQFQDNRVKAVVEMISDTLIASEMNRPTEDNYVFWFMKYAGMDEDTARKCYENRSQVGLP